MEPDDGLRELLGLAVGAMPVLEGVFGDLDRSPACSPCPAHETPCAGSVSLTDVPHVDVPDVRLQTPLVPPSKRHRAGR